MGKMRDVKESKRSAGYASQQNQIRSPSEIKARIAELERTYDDRGGCQNPNNEKLLIERAALMWVLGGTGSVAHKGMW